MERSGGLFHSGSPQFLRQDEATLHTEVVVAPLLFSTWNADSLVNTALSTNVGMTKARITEGHPSHLIAEDSLFCQKLLEAALTPTKPTIRTPFRSKRSDTVCGL